MSDNYYIIAQCFKVTIFQELTRLHKKGYLHSIIVYFPPSWCRVSFFSGADKMQLCEKHIQLKPNGVDT